MRSRPGLPGVVSILFLMTTLQWIGPELLRYEPLLIKQGELWRLLTGHWIHANWPHYALNMVGLVLCWALTEVSWRLHQWGWRVVLLSLGISLLMLVFEQDTVWYVGFSGALFGLYVLAAIDSLPRQRFLASSLLAIVALKVTLDQVPSVKMNSSELIGVPVLTEAHLYGAVVALVIVILNYALGFLSVKPTQDFHE